MQPLFTSSRLIPLAKPNGGVRPIAVGEMLYRLAMRCIVKAISHRLPSFQLGIGNKGGVEPLIHHFSTACRDETLIGLDLRNAFNSISRDFVYRAIRSTTPELSRAFVWAYGTHSKLILATGDVIHSCSGVRQGDPLGPLVFSIGYSPVHQDLCETLIDNSFPGSLPLSSYLDDTRLLVPPARNDEVLRLTE